TMFSPLRTCSSAFLFLWLKPMSCQHRLWTGGTDNRPSFPSSLASVLFSPDFYSVSDACLSSAYASYDRQTQSHLKILTETETGCVLACVVLCPFPCGCYLGTTNVSFGYGCVNGRDGTDVSAANGNTS